MSTLTPLRSLSARTLAIISALPATLRAALLSPFITGPLLYILTRGPPHLRARLLAIINQRIAITTPERIKTLITTLKILVAIGTTRFVSGQLDKLALNYWYLPGRRPSTPWTWDGKTESIVVTGGCSGFGKEIVRLLQARARCIVLDRSPLPADMQSWQGVSYYNCDLTDTAAVVKTCQTIRAEHGTPTVLINNAGIGVGKTVLDTSNEEVEAIVKVNLISHFVLIKEFVPGMLNARRGHVVTMASMASFASVPGLVDYCVTKVGALALHEGFRNELLTTIKNGRTINMTSVHPGWHSTGITKDFEEPLKAKGVVFDPAENVAKAVVDQILAARSGQLFVPKEMSKSAGSRRLPIWLQDLLVSNKGVIA